MINYRIIAQVYSLILIIAGLFMILSAAISGINGDPIGALILSGIFTIIAGGMVYTPLHKEEKVFGNKEGFLIIAGIWILLGLAGTLPYMLSGTIRNFGDALFESISGFTTTGASIIADVESCSTGILFWRSATQWIGGFVFIILTISVIPVRTINIQLSFDEFSGNPSDKIHPRTTGIFKLLAAVYITLTIIETVLLMFGGMDSFDAICHSFSTISTGGFSTRNDGINAFGSTYILIILTLFMFLSGASLTIAYYGVIKRYDKILGNNEFVLYSVLFIFCALTGALTLTVNNTYPIGKSALEAFFQTASMLSTTGFYNSDYNTWGNFILMGLVIMMIIGSCTGSAGGGIKSIRLLIAYRIVSTQIKSAMHPNAIIPVRNDNKAVPNFIITNVLIFIIIYLTIVSCSAFILSLFDFDLLTSFSLTVSMLSNVGYAPGEIGPFTTFTTISAGAKLFLMFIMTIGRLGFISVLILFTKGFYKR